MQDLTRKLPSALEWLLIQVVLYLLLWLSYEYLARLLSILLGAIFFAIWVVSVIVEWIEPSKVPRQYFRFLLASFLAPLLAAGLFVVLGKLF